FSFHLLLTYLADHVDIHVALLVSSAMSIFLVVSYMRLVVGTRFAFLGSGLAQFVYLVLFSYTFFLEGYTGLAITILCIITLFIIMQLTGRVDWSKQFTKQL
ncbi:MAG: inner membrane CreD family protein, partial [bacterium]